MTNSSISLTQGAEHFRTRDLSQTWWKCRQLWDTIKPPSSEGDELLKRPLKWQTFSRSPQTPHLSMCYLTKYTLLTASNMFQTIELQFCYHIKISGPHRWSKLTAFPTIWPVYQLKMEIKSFWQPLRCNLWGSQMLMWREVELVSGVYHFKILPCPFTAWAVQLPAQWGVVRKKERWAL